MAQRWVKPRTAALVMGCTEKTVYAKARTKRLQSRRDDDGRLEVFIEAGEESCEQGGQTPSDRQVGPSTADVALQVLGIEVKRLAARVEEGQRRGRQLAAAGTVVLVAAVCAGTWWHEGVLGRLEARHREHVAAIGDQHATDLARASAEIGRRRARAEAVSEQLDAMAARVGQLEHDNDRLRDRVQTLAAAEMRMNLGHEPVGSQRERGNLASASHIERTGD